MTASGRQMNHKLEGAASTLEDRIGIQNDLDKSLLQCGSLSSGSWPEPNHLLERLPNSCQMAIPSWSVTQRICSNKLHAGPNQLLFGSPGGEE
ncbi:bublin coiled-coil protein isoform X2 [Malaclemys terrapin pileata]|uniref:bublin coiled-coil protein isoform X2 n=1 Tax=Malaclemys terrapin pileata TaxID=2991368 RepID=UPI0023A88FCE|nr:bublin coiled-coil protein isoform X2 [Malaclemys terrapin pileata]